MMCQRPEPTVGQRVAGPCQGACSVNEHLRAFAEYVVCSFDQSLCLTAAQALFFRMGVEAPFPWRGSRAAAKRGASRKSVLSVFINGASTSVGMYAYQLFYKAIDACGRKITLFGTSSPKYFNVTVISCRTVTAAYPRKFSSFTAREGGVWTPISYQLNPRMALPGRVWVKSAVSGNGSSNLNRSSRLCG